MKQGRRVEGKVQKPKRKMSSEQIEKRKKNIIRTFITIVALLIIFAIAMVVNNFIILDNNKTTNLVINNKNVTSNLKNEILIEDNIIYLSKGDIENFFDKYIYEDPETNQIITTYDKKIAAIGFEDNKITVNGSQKDIYAHAINKNGTTYLPVRAIGNAIGKQVSWDGGTQTVYIGENLGQNTYLMDVCPPYESKGFYDESFEMGGEMYAHGFKLYGSSSDYALFNLNGRYATLEFDMGHVDGYGMKKGTYEFYLDGQLVKTISMDAEDRVQHVTIPLNYALQMKIVPIETFGVPYGFANVILK